MIEIQDLRTFRTVVREGGITRAADRLGRVQSSVTARIQKMEADLGRPLFLREGKAMHISAAGRQLLGYADRILALADEAEAALRDPTPRGELRIGAMDSTAAVRLPEPMIRFHRQFPEASLKLSTGNPIELSARVIEGDLDAALIAGEVAWPRFDAVPVYRESLVLVGRPPFSAADPLPEKLIVFENGCPHRKRLEEVYASAGSVAAETFQIASYHAMFASVMAGMGIALMPESTYRSLPGHEAADAVPLPSEIDGLVTHLIWRKGGTSPLIEAFRSVLPAL